MAPPTEVDVIIVGGGAAGCVVAGRLAKADPTLTIAIIEAGQNNLDFPTSIQPAMYLSHIAPGSTTANFYTSKGNDQTENRAHVVPCGGMLGGGSSINFLMYTRGSASDYDDWNTEGWAFDDLLPLARKVETNHLPNQTPKVHGSTGPLNVTYGGHQSELSREFITATASCYDVPYSDDINDFKTGHGISPWGKWIHPTSGRRQDTAHGFVHPIMKTQTNLHLLVEQKTIRVIFDENKRATGVEYCANPLAKVAINPDQPPTVGTIHTMKARKLVVVSSGAFGTPLILERSGVGAADRLEKLDIPVVADVPGVGKEYQDHQLTLATYKVADDADTFDDYLRGNEEVHKKVGAQWLKDGSGPVASNGIDACMKCRPTEAELAEMGPAFGKVWKDYFVDKPDKPVMFGGILGAFLGDHSLLPPGRYCMLAGYLEYPMSKGYLHINSKDPFAAPDFDAGYLSDEADMAPQVWMYKVLREIGRRMPSSRGEMAAIHPKFAEDSPARCRDKTKDDPTTGLVDYVYSDADNKAIEQWMRENVGTTWHSMATCPMKPRAEGGVVDARLNVYGTTGLKLAGKSFHSARPSNPQLTPFIDTDLSICPSNVGSNTYSVALTVGEKAAMIIGEDLGIAV
ncbi:hypothetical protein RQP46_007016 [Phenoliferia psychrophenolica]